MAHKKVINVGQSLGYLRSDSGGVCNGFVMKWLEAQFLQENEVFNQRITRITTNPPTDSHIQLIKNKVKRHDELTTDEKEILSVLAFYEGISLYHHPEEYSELFNTPLSQTHMDLVSKLCASDEINSLGGLDSIYSDAGIYTQQETKDYITNLTQIMCSVSEQNQRIFGFNLSSINHAVGATYDVEKNLWTIMDINDWPAKEFNGDQMDELATYLYDAFVYPQEEPFLNPLVFNTNLFVTADNTNKDLLVSKFSEFKNQGVITEAISQRTNINELMMIAAMQDHVNTINSLIQYDVDFSTFNSNGTTPIHHAVSHGSIDVIIALTQHSRAKFELSNLFDITGFSPVMIAAGKGNMDVIAVLTSYDVDLNQPNKEGKTAAHVAAERGQAKALIELAKHNANLFAIDINGNTPLQLGRNNPSVVRAILSTLSTEKALDIVNQKDQAGYNLLHTLTLSEVRTSCSSTLHYLLNLYPETQRYQAVTDTVLYTGNTLLHFIAHNPEELSVTLNSLPAERRFEALMLTNKYKETVINLASESPACLSAILNTLTTNDQFNIVLTHIDCFSSSQLLAKLQEIILNKIKEQEFPEHQSEFIDIKQHISAPRCFEDLKEQMIRIEHLINDYSEPSSAQSLAKVFKEKLQKEISTDDQEDKHSTKKGSSSP